MVSKIPPPPPLAKDQQTFNRWLIELTAILNSQGDVVATAVTQPIGTNNDDIATCAFVIQNAGGTPASAIPLVDATPGVVGTSLKFAREDHVHPTDTSRAALASPTFTGAPAAPTAPPGTNTTQIATTAFVEAATAVPVLTAVSASLGADVNLNDGAYHDGPSVAQGTTGTFFASGTITLTDTSGAATFDVKLWDGTTVIASTVAQTSAANALVAVALSGQLTSPAANIRISALDTNGVPAGKIKFNASGNSKDSTLTVLRIG